MSRTRWLVMRGHDALWAVRSDRVRSVESSPRGVRVNLDRHVLVADRVLEATAELEVAGGGSVTRSVIPAGCVGLALVPAGPVLVVDAESPPAPLLAVATATRAELEEDEDGVRTE